MRRRSPSPTTAAAVRPSRCWLSADHDTRCCFLEIQYVCAFASQGRPGRSSSAFLKSEREFVGSSGESASRLLGVRSLESKGNDINCFIIIIIINSHDMTNIISKVMIMITIIAELQHRRANQSLFVSSSGSPEVRLARSSSMRGVLCVRPRARGRARATPLKVIVMIVVIVSITIIIIITILIVIVSVVIIS